MRPRVLCDTNVLVSAFIAGGPPSRIIERAIDGRIELALVEPVLAELERVLVAKIGLEQEEVGEIATLLCELATVCIAALSGTVAPVTGDADDDLILACTVEGQVEILVSGDRRHLLPVGAYKGVRIVTAIALLAELADL